MDGLKGDAALTPLNFRGIALLLEGLKGNAALTSLDLQRNDLDLIVRAEAAHRRPTLETSAARATAITCGSDGGTARRSAALRSLPAILPPSSLRSLFSSFSPHS